MTKFEVLKGFVWFNRCANIMILTKLGPTDHLEEKFALKVFLV